MSSGSVVSMCRTIVCVGRNYVKHAQELGNAVPTQPVLFLKPCSSLLFASPVDVDVEHPPSILLPDAVTELHHEIEIGLVISQRARDVTPERAHEYVAGVVVALDMTARNVQDEAKKQGLPWSVSKGYDTFCPVSSFVPKEKLPVQFLSAKHSSQQQYALELYVSVDGVEKQRGLSSNMIFSPAYLIAYISRIFTLEKGDLILTGTPEGVGQVKPNQSLHGGIVGLEKEGAELMVRVKRRVYDSPL